MMLTVRQSTLPSLAWLIPETSDVPISEKWTAAEAAAGDPGGEQEGRGRHPVRHAQRAIDELGEEPDNAEDDEIAHG